MRYDYMHFNTNIKYMLIWKTEGTHIEYQWEETQSIKIPQ